MNSCLVYLQIESRDAANQHSAAEYKEVTTSTENIMVTAGWAKCKLNSYYYPSPQIKISQLLQRFTLVIS